MFVKVHPAVIVHYHNLIAHDDDDEDVNSYSVPPGLYFVLVLRAAKITIRLD